jgi:hypothetical protein
VVPHRVATEPSQILSARNVLRVVEAMGVREVAAAHSQLMPEAIHFSEVDIKESSLLSFQSLAQFLQFERDVFFLDYVTAQLSQKKCGVVTAGQHHAVEKIFDTVLGLMPEVSGRSFDRARDLGGPYPDGLRLEVVLF